MEDKLDKIKEDWVVTNQLLDDEYLENFLPDPLVNAAARAMAEVQASSAEMELVLAESWQGDPKGVFERTQAAVQAGELNMKRLVDQVQLATDMNDN